MHKYILSVDSLSHFLYLVKNLRGIIYLNDVASVSASIKWLKKKFRYRLVGISPNLYKKITHPLSRPFVILPYPNEELHTLVEFLKSWTNSILMESLLLASLYVSPLFLLDEKAIQEIQQFAIFTIDGPPLDDRSIKLHLRILDYATVDAHVNSVHSCAMSIKQVTRLLMEDRVDDALLHLKKELEIQEQFAYKDGNSRFWRFKEQKSSLTPMVFYLHPIKLIVDKWGEVIKVKDQLVSTLEKFVDPYFSLTLGFKLPCLQMV